MKTAAYYALHYGKEYLAHSLRSIQDAVDEIYVFYSPTTSYGTVCAVECPESEEELEAEIRRFATKPIHWIKGSWGSEGAHRNGALDHMKAQGVEIVLVVDADEAWAPGAARQALEYAMEQNGPYRYGVNFINFWRSTRWVVTDGFRPLRVIDLRQERGCGDAPVAPEIAQPLHFGYALSISAMEYKWVARGNQFELRKEWLDRYRTWTPDAPGDLHPTSRGLWNAMPTPEDTLAIVRGVLDGHPYRDLDLIV